MSISAILQYGGQLFLTSPFLLRQAEATRTAEEAEANDDWEIDVLFFLEIHDRKSMTGWWQLKHFLFSPLLGEDEPILTHIFQIAGSTTNQMRI